MPRHVYRARDQRSVGMEAHETSTGHESFSNSDDILASNFSRFCLFLVCMQSLKLCELTLRSLVRPSDISFWEIARLDLFIDYVVRNAILQVFVYDNSLHKPCGTFSSLYFRFLPRSPLSEFCGINTRCTMTHCGFYVWMEIFFALNILFALSTIKSLFLLSKILGTNDFTTRPSNASNSLSVKFCCH